MGLACAFWSWCTVQTSVRGWDGQICVNVVRPGLVIAEGCTKNTEKIVTLCLQVSIYWSVSFSLRKNFKIKGALTIASLKASFGP